MRSIVLQRSQVGIARAFKLGFLGLIMMTVGTGQALAQAKSCNPDLDFNIANPGPYFLGDAMRVSANLGARDIDAGNYMDIESFGFALNCHSDEDFHSCTDAGNDVAFLTTPVTDCLNAAGDPATLIIPQTNIIPIRVQGPPIRTPKNSQCNVQFDISVTGLDTDDDGNVINNRIVQAMGWPIDGGDPALCDNGLTSAATSTISYDVETCGIEVEKQVSIDQENWFDADGGDDGSLTISYAERAYYRLIVKNTSSVDYIGQMHITDPELSFEGWVDGIAAGAEVTIGGDGSGFDVNTICEVLGEGDFTFTNTATVEGVCRTDAHPLGEVLASASDVAVVNCRTVRTVPAVLIEKSTNGFDADTAPGPTVDWGSQVTWDYVVYNVGQEPLTLNAIYDDLEGNIVCEKSQLAVDEYTNCTAKTGTAISGQYANLATVEATSTISGTQVSDTDPSHYYAEPPQPAIKVLKEVWDGQGWADANDEGTAPVKYWPSGALYRVTVENTGPVALDNVTITDAEVGINNLTVNAGSLAVGQKVVLSEAEVGALNVVGVCTESGSYENTVIANGKGVVNGLAVQSTDNAFVVCVGTPEITVKKYISIDGGDTFVDGTAGPVQAPSGALYKITVENTGDVDLVDVTVDDSRIPGGPYDVGKLAIDEVVTLTSGEWAELDMAQVCGSSGLIENIATAEGTSAEWADDGDSDSDNAKLDCIGEPMISILKEVSLDGGANWHDADVAPYPTAVVDDSPETGLYRITVGNVGSVPLSDVVVNDSTLGIVDYEVGTLAVSASVVLVSGDIPALSVSDICDSRGEKANVAYATGSSAAGVEDEASDSATIDCIGDPAIRVLKEVSKDGVNYSAVGVTALAPADAYYRITVENIGNVDLENVVINDATLGIVDFVPVGAGGAGSLAMSEQVVIAHANAGNNTLTDLFVPTLCEAAGDFPNTVIADGKAVDSTQTVNDDDSAMFSCETPVDICSDEGAGDRPKALKLEYNGTPGGINAQGADGTFVNGFSDYSAVAIVNVSDGKSPGQDFPAVLGQLVNLDGSFTSTGNADKIPPNIRFEFLTVDGVLVHWIEFHGSCSLPLLVYDEYAGMTIIGYTP